MSSNPTDSCVFCDIVAGRAPASAIYGDERVLAFMDVGPVTPGHFLVVPRRHVPALADLDVPSGQHLFAVTMRLAAALRRSGLRCEGVNLFLADGAAAFQDVFHLHMHVIPRFAGDGFTIDANWSQRPGRAELDRTATLIRQADAASEPATSE